MTDQTLSGSPIEVASRRTGSIHIFSGLILLAAAALPGCGAELDPTGRYVLDLEQVRRVQQQDGIALSPEQLAALAPLEATPAADGGLPSSGSLVLEGGRFTLVLSHHGRESRRTGSVMVKDQEILLKGTAVDSSDHHVQYRVRVLDPWLHLFVDAGDVPRLIFRRESH